MAHDPVVRLYEELLSIEFALDSTPLRPRRRNELRRIAMRERLLVAGVEFRDAVRPVPPDTVQIAHSRDITKLAHMIDDTLRSQGDDDPCFGRLVRSTLAGPAETRLA